MRQHVREQEQLRRRAGEASRGGAKEKEGDGRRRAKQKEEGVERGVSGWLRAEVKEGCHM